MNDKTFRCLLLILVGLGIAFTLAHLIYAIFAYQSSSIIQFIMKEWW